MIEQLFTTSISETLTITSTLAILLSSLALGVFISLVYMATRKNENYSSGFTISLIMLPAIIAMIILLVGNNVARAFSLAGAFSLIRFRSAPGDSKDIAYVFFTLGIGLACGMGYIGYAVLFAVILCVTMFILTKINFGKNKNTQMRLKIIIPEDLEYRQAFDDILDKYTTERKLTRVKTAEFGSVFELVYLVRIKDIESSKQMIDEIRCRNGNLNIMLLDEQITETPMF